MATGCVHPYGGRPPRPPLWLDRNTGTVKGPEYLSLSTYVAAQANATFSYTDPGAVPRTANKAAILAAIAACVASKKALLVDGQIWWESHGISAVTGGLDITASGVKIMGRTRQAFPSYNPSLGMDGFVGVDSDGVGQVSPVNGLISTNATGQEYWNILIKSVGSATRAGGNGLALLSATNAKVVGVETQGHTECGFFLFGFDNVYYANCLANGNLSDAFYLGTTTNPRRSGKNLYMEHCLADNSGDDMYGMHSATSTAYGAREYVGRNITIRRSRGLRVISSGGGVAIASAYNLLYEDIDIQKAVGQGIWVDSDSVTFFGETDDVTVRRVTIGNVVAGTASGYGIYLINNTTFAQNNLEFIDCTIGKTASSPFLVTASGTSTISNVTFTRCNFNSLGLSNHGCSVTGDASNLLWDNCSWGTVAGFGGAYLSSASTHDVEFRDCIIESTAAGQAAINITALVANVVIDGCTLTNVATGFGIHATAAVTGLVINNNTVNAGGAGAKGIDIGAAAVSPQITNNNVVLSNGATVGILGSAGAMVAPVITGNTITASSSDGIGINGGCSGGALIDGNTITTTVRHGIALQAGALSGMVIISNNVISDIDTAGTAVGSALLISMNSAAGILVISGNTHTNPNNNSYNWDWNLVGQTTAGAHQVTNNIRGAGTNAANAAYTVTGINAGTGIHTANPDPGWTKSGNT